MVNFDFTATNMSRHMVGGGCDARSMVTCTQNDVGVWLTIYLYFHSVRDILGLSHGRLINTRFFTATSLRHHIWKKLRIRPSAHRCVVQLNCTPFCFWVNWGFAVIHLADAFYLGKVVLVQYCSMPILSECLLPGNLNKLLGVLNTLCYQFELQEHGESLKISPSDYPVM